MVAKKNIRIRVRAGDTDFTGYWFNAKVIEWFSAGRTELLRSRKITYSEDTALIAEGHLQDVSIVLVEVSARFYAPARFDDLVQLQTKVTEVRDKTIKFEYAVKRLSDKKILATGSSISVCIDRKARRSTRIPQRIAELLTT